MRRVGRVFPLGAAVELASGVGVTLAVRPPHAGFYVGFMVGVTFGLLVALADSHRITSSGGEPGRTARRPLPRP